MDLNKIELTEDIVVELFKNSLIETSFEPGRKTADTINIMNDPENKTQQTGIKIKKDQSPGDIKFLGGNNKNILLLVNYSMPGYLPDDQLSFLISILNACKVNLQDVAVVNQYQNKECDYDQLARQFNPRIIILFAIDTEALQMPFGVPDFQVQELNKITHVLSPSLESLQINKELKSKLWICLQRIFF